MNALAKGKKVRLEYEEDVALSVTVIDRDGGTHVANLKFHQVKEE